MWKDYPNQRRLTYGLKLLTIATAALAIEAGCGGAPGDGPRSNGGTTTLEEQILLEDPLSYEGSLGAKVVDTQTTRASTVDPSSAQEVPPGFDTEDTIVRFKDLAGNALLDPNGLPIEAVPLESDGSFFAEDLPVGVDFTVCADIGQDGTCDIESCVLIPSKDGGKEGLLFGAQVDPLTTTVLARLREALQEHDVDIGDLPVSPVAIVARVVQAYTHLFEETGIDETITLDDIVAVALENRADLFNELIPAIARTSMEIAEGNLELAKAEEIEDRVLALAEVFLRAGFPIADGPGEPDLSPLAELDGVIAMSRYELMGPEVFDEFTAPPEKLPEEFFEDIPDEFLDFLSEDLIADLSDMTLDELPPEFFEGLPDEFSDLLEIGFAEDDGPDHFDPGDETIYINTTAEPDRNFAGESEDESMGEEGMPPMPMLSDHILFEMARLHHEGRRITLGDLYHMLTSLDGGLGVRLVFSVFDPHFFGPPLTVFETSDGEGKAINIEEIFFRFFSEGFDDFDPESFERREAELRALLSDLLADTIPPTYERLFGAFAGDRIEGIDHLTDRVRSALAHLPFSRSGPSAFYVVADGDPFMSSDDTVSAITVDADVSIDGVVAQVFYNSTGDGRFYLGFTGATDSEGIVELLVRETGRFLHGPRGPARLNMNDDSIFAPVDGQRFVDFVSERGTFYPGTHVAIIHQEFVPEHTLPEPMAAQFDPGPEPGPNEQMFVLATAIGFDSEPVRVDYDRFSGIATFNPGGRNLLMFLPDSHETGVFALFNEDTGRPASFEDPTAFFQAPPEMPEGFEEFFNEFDDEQHFEDFTAFEDFFDEEFPLPPPDGEYPDGEYPPPPDGEFPDGEYPPPPDGEFSDGEYPPPPDGEFPDGEMPPPDEPPPDEPPADEPPPPVEPPPDPAQVDEGDPVDGVEPSPVDGQEPPPLEGDEFLESPPIDGEESPLIDGEYPPPPPEGEEPFFDGGDPYPIDGGYYEPSFIYVAAEEVIGLDLSREMFTRIFGTDVPNERWDPSGDPYFDDVNGNGIHDPEEPTTQFRPTLFEIDDWRSTDIRLYYRRADNGGPVTFDDVDFESPTPRTFDGVDLVPREYVPRLNAFRFGRPNTAVNLLTAFLPPEFFDGTHSLDRDTSVDIFSAVAIINLVMEQVLNIEAEVDIDGIGPMPRERMLMDAYLFVAPIGDPFMLLLKGFRDRSVVPAEQ